MDPLCGLTRLVLDCSGFRYLLVQWLAKQQVRASLLTLLYRNVACLLESSRL